MDTEYMLCGCMYYLNPSCENSNFIIIFIFTKIVKLLRLQNSNELRF